MEQEGFRTACSCLQRNTECDARCSCEGRGTCLNRAVTRRETLRVGEDVAVGLFFAGLFFGLVCVCVCVSDCRLLHVGEDVEVGGGKEVLCWLCPLSSVLLVLTWC